MGTVQYQSGSRALTWSGTPAVGQQVVITYSSTVQTGAVQRLVNTASLQGSNVSISVSAAIIANGYAVMLPLAITDP